jgi:hypothetical protein
MRGLEYRPHRTVNGLRQARQFHRLARVVLPFIFVASRQTAVGGEGKRAEIDGGYFGGYVKPANRRENRRDRRLRQSVGQAQGRRCDPRARRQDAPRRVP